MKTTIKNIIFDLGGVILNLAPQKTEAAFMELAGSEAAYLQMQKTLFGQNHFANFETNAIPSEEFVQQIQQLNNRPLSTQQVETAWSAMLLDMPAYRIDLIKKLKTNGYRIFLLSNINSIHLRDVYAIIQQEHPGLDFDALFETAYYSHLIERRKPDLSTFQFLLDDAGLEAETTLFIDDTLDNIEAAEKVGIQGWHHPRNSNLEDSLIKAGLRL